MEDIRYALRMQRKRLGFTVAAVLTLALGIGANTAIFSVINTVLLRSLPYKDPERLVVMVEKHRKRGELPVAYPNFVDWRKQSDAFEEVAAYRPGTFIHSDSRAAEHIPGKYISGNFFRALGVMPLLGRDFLPEEDQAGANPVVVVSHRFWHSRLGGKPGWIGRTLVVNERPWTVVGVLPPGFRFGGEADVYMPLGPIAHGEERTNHSAMTVVARRRANVTLEQARAQMEAIASRLEQQYPEANRDETVKLVPLRERITAGIRPVILALFGAVGLVLLVACVNVANMLLARSAERGKEFAVRAALGASRRRMARQLVTESLLLALEGGALGLLLAVWTSKALLRFVPTDLAVEAMPLDVRVLGFTLLVSCLTGLVFGLAPALHISRHDLNEGLKEGGRTTDAGFVRHGFRNALLVSEVALSLALLIGAGLLLRSAARVLGIHPGFRPENILTFRVALTEDKLLKMLNVKQLSDIRYEHIAPVVGPYQQELVRRIHSLPGVQYAASVFPLPMSGDSCRLPLDLEGHPIPAGGTHPEGHYHVISPDYFRAMGIPLLKGRYFSASDNHEAPQVAIVSETTARRFWPNEDPVGKRVRPVHGPLREWTTVVGVVGDTRQYGLEAATPAQIYFPYLQAAQSMVLVVKTPADPLSLAPAIRKEVAAFDRELPVYDVQTMEERLSDSLTHRRRITLLLGIFAALALVLTAIGIYGVMAFSVTQRTHEIGVRLALGAKAGDVLRMVIGKAMFLAAAGVAIGLAVSLSLTRLLASLLFGVSATDVVTFTGSALLLGCIALAASYIPARKAAALDPIAALRCE